MKNSFSKTLICGVIASSFILINCQKATSGRGVKGIRSGTDTSQGTPPVNANPEMTTEAKESFLIKCSPEFMNQYKIWTDTYSSTNVKDISKLKKDDLTESQKEELNLLAKLLESESKNVMSEFDKMLKAQSENKNENQLVKKNLNGCFGKDQNVNLVLSTKENTNYIALEISKLTGQKTPAAIEGEKEINDRKEKSAAESDVTKNAHYYVSEELNQVFDDAKIDDSYFMDGKVLTGESNLNKAKEDVLVSVCMTSETSGKIEDLKTTLDALSTESSEKVADKKAHKIRFANEGRLYTLSCVLPATKKLAVGFAEAMGELLMTKKQIAKKEKVTADEKSKTEKEVVKEDTKSEDKKEKEEVTKEDKETSEEVVKSKTEKKSVTKPAKKVTKVKITAKQKQAFLDEDMKNSAEEVEKETKADEVSEEHTITEEKYIPAHLRSKK